MLDLLVINWVCQSQVYISGVSNLLSVALEISICTTALEAVASSNLSECRENVNYKENYIKY